MRRTNRGKTIDFDSIIAQQADVPAVGNMPVNARGDVLGENGTVVKSAHDRVREYYDQNPNAVSKSVSIKQGSLDKTLDLEQPDDGAETAPEQKKQTEPKPARKTKNAQPKTEYREVEMPNGDIKMVPVDEEFDDE